MNHKLNHFFDVAIDGKWRMTWAMWRLLILEVAEWGIIDNDSGHNDSDYVNAIDAKNGLMQCTIGPAKLFNKPQCTPVSFDSSKVVSGPAYRIKTQAELAAEAVGFDHLSQPV
jgi:hypothetical protein